METANGAMQKPKLKFVDKTSGRIKGPTAAIFFKALIEINRSGRMFDSFELYHKVMNNAMSRKQIIDMLKEYVDFVERDDV